MILSDRTLRQMVRDGVIKLDPYDDALVQPASIDVRLGVTFADFVDPATSTAGLPRVIDPQEFDAGKSMTRIDAPNGFVLRPGGFVLGTTIERLTLPDNVVARVEGKSSLGRLGLLVHATAGFVDPGWADGKITLEFTNVAPLPILLYPGMKIAQLSFMQMDGLAERPYGHPGLGSKYQGQSDTTPSRYADNYQPVRESQPCPTCGATPWGRNPLCNTCAIPRKGY